MLNLSSLKKNKHRLIVETGPSWLKWVVAQGSGEHTLFLGMGALSMADRAAASLQLAEIVKKYKIAPENVTTCLPRSQVTARNLELPSIDSSEIKKIVDLQAVKQTPYAADEIVFDYYLLSAFREGYSSVMLVIAHRDVLNAHLKVIQDAGLKSPTITLGTECSGVWVAGHLKDVGVSETIAVLDVDLENTDFYIFRGGSILFTQNLSYGVDKIEADPEAAANRLIDEMARAFQIYRSEEISNEPTTIALVGSYHPLVPMKNKIIQATGLKMQEVAMPEALRQMLRQKEAGPAGAYRLSYSSVLGLAARPKDPPINLIPHEVVIQETLMQKGRSLMVTGVLSLAIFLLVVASFGARYYEKQNYLKQLELKSEATYEPAATLAKKRQRINEILKVHNASLKFFDDLLYVVNAIPQEIYLTEISLTRGNHFLLQGRATSMKSGLDFVSALKQNASFTSVESKRLNKRMVENKEVVDFEIDCEISSNPPEKR